METPDPIHRIPKGTRQAKRPSYIDIGDRVLKIQYYRVWVPELNSMRIKPFMMDDDLVLFADYLGRTHNIPGAKQRGKQALDDPRRFKFAQTTLKPARAEINFTPKVLGEFMEFRATHVGALNALD